MRWFASGLALVLLCGFGCLALAEEYKEEAEDSKDTVAGEVIVPAGSTWKYLHPIDGKDPADKDSKFNEEFSTLSFDDSKWKEGKDGEGPEAGFGYGDPVDVTWDIPKSENRKTAYLRHKFTTKAPMTNLTISMQRDDAVIVYIDGKEVGRDNVGTGKEAYDLMAKGAIGGDDEKKVVTIKLKDSLKAGEHVLAISLHNAPAPSSDLRIAEITLRGVSASAKD